MKLVEVILRSSRKFENKDAEKLRGYMGNYFREVTEFHNHLDEISFNYDFSYIQYRVINGQLAIIGIDKGGDILLENIQDICEVKIKDDIVKVTPEIKITFPELKITEEFHKYKFETLWFALNEKNYKRYMKGELSLNDQLRNNIIEFFKMCNIWADKKIIVTGEFREEKMYKKDIEVLGFGGEFSTNVLLPDGISLGKRKSIGLGRIKKID